MTIQEAWNKRRELCAEGDKLYAEGAKLYDEGTQLRVKGSRLGVEGDLVLFDTVIAVHGNVEIKWDGKDAIVKGVRYEWEPPAPCDGKEVEIEGVKYKLIKV